jgi:Tol biopolymer transport system component
VALAPGSRLGPYEILGALGAGGMGEVYRAHDTNLKRDVALKILPDSFANDPDRLARFQREAQVLASLNHPNIAHIHGLEESAGVRALVMELVEGDDLSQRIARGAIPLDEALPIAKQIAEALEAAHEQGIIHRDLKPANIKVRPDGLVKVLDFGLAKLVETRGIHGQAAVAALSESPTITSPAVTQAGVILGTAAYMAPEQVKGAVVDRRADIWAFGASFYEMLSGRRAFTGDGVSDTHAAVLRQDVDWTALPASTPTPVRRLIARCLERDVRRRLRDIGEARIALDDSAAGTIRVGAVEEGAPIRAPRSWWRRAMPAAIAAIVTATLAGTAVWYLNRGSSTPPAVTRLSFDLPVGQTFTGTTRHILAISPDGTQMVYAANDRLHIRSMAQFDARPLQGTEGDSREPVFSPDGRSVAFYSVAEKALKRVAVSGGAAVTISPADDPSGMSWGPDGIVFGQGTKGVMRVSPDGGTPDVLVRTKDGQTVSNPHVLPGRTHLLFTLASGSAPDRWERARVIVQSLTSGEPRTLIEGGSDGRYVPTGHLVYALSGSLFAVAFDLQRLEVTGDPVPILDGIRRSSGSTSGVGAVVTPGVRITGNPGAGEANFSFSGTGALVYVAGPSVAAGSGFMDIVLTDRTQAIEPLKIPPGRYTTPRASPDGRRIAFGSDDGTEAIIWTYNLTGTSARQRLTLGGANRFPIWTSDSQRVVFQSDRDGDLAIFSQPADSAGTPERLTKPAPGESHVPESWSPRADTLLFSVTRGSDVSLATLSLRNRVVTPFGDVHSSTPPGAVFSPDGRWVAYSSTQQARTTIYVQPFPPTGAKYQLVPNGSDTPKHPRWSPDGRELIYNPRPTGNEAVGITTQPTFAFGKPMALPRLIQGGPPGTRTPYDVMPDGRLLGFITTGSTRFTGGSANQVQVVLSWFEELKRLVPTKSTSPR